MGATAHDNNNLRYGQTNADGTISKQNSFVDSLSTLPIAAKYKPQTDIT